MLRTTALLSTVLALALAGPASEAAAQPRATAPVGYLVAYARSDGAALSDGKSYRIVGVTRDFRTRNTWVDEVNSYHRLKAIVIELKTEDEYKAGIQLLNGQANPGPARPPAQPAMASVSGTRWQWGGDTMYFYSDGTYEIVEFTKGAVSNLRGKWTQTGNKVTTSGVGTWTVDGDRMSNAFATRTKLK